MVGTLLSIVIFGLILSYSVLIYKIKKYYYENMKVEYRRITILFASFNISYVLRLAYLILATKQIHFIHDHYHREIWRRFLPLLFDLSSILAILILHFISFRNSDSKNSSKLPKAGHFKDESALPRIDDVIVDGSNVEKDEDKEVTLQMQIVDTD